MKGNSHPAIATVPAFVKKHLNNTYRFLDNAKVIC